MKRILTAIVLIACYPLVWVLQGLFWWSIHANGVDPKNGQQRYHHKTENGNSYYKKEGFLNFYKPWKKSAAYNDFRFNADINSMYPSVMLLDPLHTK